MYWSELWWFDMVICKSDNSFGLFIQVTQCERLAETGSGWVFVVCTHQLVAATCCQSKLRHCRRRRWSTENVSSVKLSGSFYTGRSVLSGFAVWFTFLFTKSLAEISNRTDFGLNYWAVFFCFLSRNQKEAFCHLCDGRCWASFAFDFCWI